MTALAHPNLEPVGVAVRRFGRPASDGGWAYAGQDVLTADEDALIGCVRDEFDRGRLALDAAGEALLDMVSIRAAKDAALLESRSASAVALLAERGVDTRVLKGIAAARLDYPAADLRNFADVDLLVRGDDMDIAVDAFAELGFRRHFAEPFDGFDARVGKGVAVGDQHGVEIDLHRTLALGYYGTRLPVDELWNDPVTFEVAGQTMQALSRVHRFVHCALHLALAPVHTGANALDLVMIAGSEPDLGATAVQDTAHRWGCCHPVAVAVAVVTERFGDTWAPPELIAWSRAHRPSLGDRAFYATFEGGLSSSRLRSATAVIGLRSASDRMFALRGLFTRGHRDRE